MRAHDSSTIISDDLQFTANALTVLEHRYLKKDDSGRPIETPEDMFRRVAQNIASAEATYGASAPEVFSAVSTVHYIDRLAGEAKAKSGHSRRTESASDKATRAHSRRSAL